MIYWVRRRQKCILLLKRSLTTCRCVFIWINTLFMTQIQYSLSGLTEKKNVFSVLVIETEMTAQRTWQVISVFFYLCLHSPLDSARLLMEAKGEAWDGHSWAVTGEKAGWWQILALRWQRTSGQPSPYTGSRTSRPPFQPEKSPAHALPPRMLGPGLGLPRNVGLPAARSFPGNRQEAWLRVGLPAAGSRVGRAGPWGSEKGGSRKTRDCCCSFSLPQLRSGRGFIQRGKWAASPLHPAYCRSDFCTWLPETKPRPPIFFFFLSFEVHLGNVLLPRFYLWVPVICVKSVICQ